jgi:hypothetical protein
MRTLCEIINDTCMIGEKRVAVTGGGDDQILKIKFG